MYLIILISILSVPIIILFIGLLMWLLLSINSDIEEFNSCKCDPKAPKRKIIVTDDGLICPNCGKKII